MKEYTEKKAYIWCLRSVDKNYARVDPNFLIDLQSELKLFFEFFQKQSRLDSKEKI